MTLSAQALGKDGNPVDAPITWRAPDSTLTVDETTGVITGVSPGTGRVQAFAGSLSSALLQFTVTATADTLIVTDSVLTVAPTETASLPLVAQIQTFNPAGPLPGWPVIYTITDPPEVIPHLVELPGGVVTDTVTHWHGWCGHHGDPQPSCSCSTRHRHHRGTLLPPWRSSRTRLRTAVHRHLPVACRRPRRAPSTSCTSGRWRGSAPDPWLPAPSATASGST